MMIAGMAMRWGNRAVLVLAIAVLAGCDMMDSNREPPQPVSPVEPEVCAGRPAETRADWNYDRDTLGVEELDFTRYERDALATLHRQGWNGDGVRIVVYDFFGDDGLPVHGEAVENVLRYYAPNATFIRRSASDGGTSLPDNWGREFFIVNASVATPAPGGADRLPVDQTRALRDNSTDGVFAGLEVWGAGNIERALPDGNPARAGTAMTGNDFVGYYAAEGMLHAKSAVVVAGAVNYRAADDGWVLSHGARSHSARAGVARHAFIVAPDDNREFSFAGTSFAAPRVSGALAILAQKCPELAPEQLAFVLLMSARDLGAPGVDEVYGHGLIDLERAMARAKELAATYDDYDSTVPKDGR